ncbi:PH domain-containing protein [Rhodohalobacter halophilus]|uniref:PH domain-containing protein n=1 Tax=Rhodohalobacter halophilus TaxID=1812810 RepID=UPI00083F8A89|nr:PH domain-containing protein [Rhodohalobacter halophilus]
MSTTGTSRKATTLQKAEFDPILKKYVYYGTAVALFFSIVGIVVLPFWLLLGKLYINRYFDNLFCELTTRALHFKKGIWFQTERTIPLDKIQDLTFHEGPVLRWMGLSKLMIETAGQSAQGMSDMSLTGIVNARQFRERVLEQRDEITDRSSYSKASTSPDNASENLAPILQEIHKTLKSIDQKLDRKK